MGSVRDLLEAFDPPGRVGDVEDELERLRERIEDLGDEAKAKGRRGYRAARRRVPSEARRLKRELGRLEHDAGTAVGDRPFQSVLAAFGLGLLVAALIGFGSGRK